MNQIVKHDKIENLIYEIRDMQVMMAKDVAKLYNTETRIINQIVKRNLNRFPKTFCFQLTKEEYQSLKSQIVISNDELPGKNTRGGIRHLPYVFTEHGIMMLSSLLKGDFAAEINVQIINAFVTMKKYISTGLLEQKYYNDMTVRHDTEIKRLESSINKLQNVKRNNEIFFAGQIYDAYSKIIDIFKCATKSIVIIDNYADKTTLDIISRLSVQVTLIVKKNTLLTKTDIKKYLVQYQNLTIIYNDDFHDRYFILDEEIVYHCGASINYAGNKTFSLSLLEDDFVKIKLIEKILELVKIN